MSASLLSTDSPATTNFGMRIFMHSLAAFRAEWQSYRIAAIRDAFIVHESEQALLLAGFLLHWPQLRIELPNSIPWFRAIKSP